MFQIHVLPENTIDINKSNLDTVVIPQINTAEDKIVFIEEKLPKPGICFTWSGAHYKTFDGKIFTFESKCAHTLAQDNTDSTFSIVTQDAQECYNSPRDCYKNITIYYQNKILTLTREKGTPIFKSGAKILPIPGHLPGIRIEMLAHYVFLSLDTIGADIKWDGYQLIQIDVNQNLWNRTEGLCGRFDGDIRNDMTGKNGHESKTVANLGNSWKVDDFKEECLEDNNTPVPRDLCDENSKNVVEFCKKLLLDERFSACHKVVDVMLLLDACKWDYCSCNATDPSKCVCDTVDVYVQSCAFYGVKNLANWRDEKTCRTS